MFRIAQKLVLFLTTFLSKTIISKETESILSLKVLTLIINPLSLEYILFIYYLNIIQEKSDQNLGFM